MTPKTKDLLIDKFLSHLYDCRDTDNLIIKGHILTEYAMNFFIEMSSAEKVHLKEIRFTYSNKIDIVKILGLFKQHPFLYGELKLLNKLRNSIAHELKYDEKILAEFLKGFERHKVKFMSDKLDRLDMKEEVFYELGNERITVKGGHMLLMFYISVICMTIFATPNNKQKDSKDSDSKPRKSSDK
jgi:hypothetical protein